MKKIMYLFSLLTLTSCAVAFQQIASISSPQMHLADDGHFAYSEDDIVVDYNFWAPSGKMSFVITNNLESDVYVDLGRSFLVVNGITYDYFQNRTYSLNYSDTFMSSDGYETSNTFAAAAATFSGEIANTDVNGSVDPCSFFTPFLRIHAYGCPIPPMWICTQSIQGRRHDSQLYGKGQSLCI